MRLPRITLILTLAYLALIVWGSLYPLAGWQDNGADKLAFLDAAFPRYWTFFDLLTNVALYAPLGLLAALACRARQWPAALACVLALLLCILLSFSMEFLQNWLPSRVPSNLDLATNALGGLFGGLVGALFGGPLLATLAEWERDWLADVRWPGGGLILLLLWALAMFPPGASLAAFGGVRHWVADAAPLAYSAERLQLIEAVAAGAALFAAGILGRHLLKPGVLVCTSALILFFLTVGAVRALAGALMVGPAFAFDWVSTGAANGMVAGGLALLGGLLLPPRVRLALGALALLIGIVAANLTPHSPYEFERWSSWRSGPYANLVGALHVLTALWPFVTLPYLLLSQLAATSAGGKPALKANPARRRQSKRKPAADPAA